MPPPKHFTGKITAKGTEITVLSHGDADDFISLTDIARYKNQNTGTNRLTAPANLIHLFMHNARGSFGEAVLGRLFGAGPCFLPRPVAP